MTSRYAGRWLVTATVLAWVGCTLLLALWWLGPLGRCELGVATSMFGQAERSWLPPGTTCTWDVQGNLVTQGPSPLRLLVLGGALAGLPLAAYLRRLLRSGSPESAGARPSLPV